MRPGGRKRYLKIAPPPPWERVRAYGSEGPTADPQALHAKIKDLEAAAQNSEGEGDRPGALSLRLKAAMLAQSLGDRASIGDLLVECAATFVALGEYHEALRYLERARDVARELNSEELKGEVYRGYGTLYRARGQLDAAAVCLDRALERLEFSSRHGSALRALIELGEIYLGQGRTAEAGALLARARAVPASADPALLVRLELNVGRLALLGGDRASAVASYELAARAAARAGRPHEREVVALGLAGLYAQEGRLAEATERLREALALSIVAFARESSRPLERSRFATIGKRLAEVDIATDDAGAGHDLRRQVDEAVRLFNAHPLVLTGSVEMYGTVRAQLAPPEHAEIAAELDAPRAEIARRTDPPNPK